MDFPSKIYIDGGDPAETKLADALLKKAGHHGLDGQTTNPSLIAKRLMGERKLTNKEAMDGYRKTVEEMSNIIPNGNISIQVIGDPATMTTEDMLTQARDRIRWIPNGVIKFPCSRPGLEAAGIFCEEGPVNITLNFSQEQAAAVFVATKTHNYDVYLSPFVGRLDDKGENGMDVVANELSMFRGIGDNHARLPSPAAQAAGGQVQVLTASVRNIKHLLYALWLKSPVITIPFKVFTEWAKTFEIPPQDYLYDVPGLAEIPYRELTLDKNWTEYDIHHDLTDMGIAKFWEDWSSIVA